MRKISLLLTLLSLVAGLRAQTTFQLSGTISTVSGTTSFTAGQPFTITFSYSTDIDDTNSNSQIGLYSPAITAYEFNYANGTYVGTATYGDFSIYNNAYGDYDEAHMSPPEHTSFADVDSYAFNSGASIYFDIINNSGTLLDSDALPEDFPTAGWDSGSFALKWGSVNSDLATPILINGSITSVSAVPEPATTAVLAGAFAFGIVLVRRRRQRQS